MKNKKQILILLPAVFLIWGIVGYRIFALSDQPVSVPGTLETTSRVSVFQPDTFSLLMNYRDPFLNAGKIHEPKTLVKNTSVMMPKPVPPVVNSTWPIVKYHGILLNQESKKTVVLVSVNSNVKVISEGDTIQNLKLVKVHKDSIQFEMEGNKKYSRYFSR